MNAAELAGIASVRNRVAPAPWDVESVRSVVEVAGISCAHTTPALIAVTISAQRRCSPGWCNLKKFLIIIPFFRMLLPPPVGTKWGENLLHVATSKYREDKNVCGEKNPLSRGGTGS